MLKRTMSLICALVMVLTVAGCGNSATSSDSSDGDVNVGGFMTYEQGTGNKNTTQQGGTNSGTTQQGGTNSGTTQQGGTVNVADKVEVTQTKSVLESKNYGGKEFTIFFWYSPSAIVDRKIAAFNKAHNAKLKKVVIVTETPQTEIAKSIASGKPYDIIAAHSNYYPVTINQGIYETLEQYIAAEDMYDASKPNDGGLLKIVNDAFSFNGHLYAVGSAQSVYPVCMFYNKKLFKDSGLDDPLTLYKQGKWTWDVIEQMSKQVTDAANGVAFLNPGNLTAWYTINTVDPIKFTGSTFVENLSDGGVVSATNSYRNFYTGSELMSLENPTTTYMSIEQIDAYELRAKNAKLSSAWGKNAKNVGVVPVPYTSLNSSKKYPGHAPQGYSSTKGAKDPSIAACYALFESRYEDTNKSEGDINEVREIVYDLFEKNGYLNVSGFMNSSGTMAYRQINREIGLKLQTGGDATSLLTAQKNVIAAMVDYSINGK